MALNAISMGRNKKTDFYDLNLLINHLKGEIKCENSLFPLDTLGSSKRFINIESVKKRNNVMQTMTITRVLHNYMFLL